MIIDCNVWCTKGGEDEKLPSEDRWIPFSFDMTHVSAVKAVWNAEKVDMEGLDDGTVIYMDGEVYIVDVRFEEGRKKFRDSRENLRFSMKN